MDRSGRSAPVALVVSLFAAACAPSLGGIVAATADEGDRTTVVNATLELTGPGTYVGSASVPFSAVTTPPGQDLQARLDSGGWTGVGASWSFTNVADGSHTAHVRVRGAPASERTATFTVDTVDPDPPTAVTVAGTTAGQLTVSWTAGSDAGSGLASYTVTYGTTSGDLDATSSATAPATGHAVTGVESCRTYYVTVHCTDRAGNTSTTTAEVPCRANCGGDGTFTEATLALANGPSVVAVGDFDGNGITDLAVDSSQAVQVLLGQGSGGRGDGSFAVGESYATGSTVTEVAVADVNADRIDDLVVLNENQLRVYLGDGSDGRGDGTFTLHATTSSNLSTPQALLVRDVDQDRIPDAIVGNWGNDTLVTFKGGGSGGRGNGTFAFAASVATGDSPGAIAAGDFDADGITDLAVACQSGGEVLVTHLGNGSDGRGDGTFAAMQTRLSGGFVAGDVLVADANGDGIDDLVCTLALANCVCFVAGSGTFGRGNGSFYLEEVIGVGTRPWGLATGEFTGDGIPDFVSFSYLEGDATLLVAGGAHGRGDASFTTSAVGAAGSSLFRGVAADANADGALDLLVGDLGGHLRVLLGNGGKGIGDATFVDRGEDAWVIGTAAGVGTSDLDSDRVPDFVVARYQSPHPGGNDWVDLYLGGEAGGLGTGTPVLTAQPAVGADPTAVVFGDFDRDRVTDIAVLCSDLALRGGGNRVDVWIGAGSGGVGTGMPASTASYAVGSNPRGIVVADFDADTILDLAVANQGGDTVTILLGNGTEGRGDGTFTAQTPIATATGPFALATGDFDADGIVDLAVGHVDGSGSGALSILRGNGSNGVGNGTFTAQAATATTHAVTGIAVGDFDGDAILDVAAAQYRFGTVDAGAGVVVFTGDGSGGRGDGTFTAGSEVAVAGNPRAVAVGDFDHDRVLDLAVVRANAQSLAILRGQGSDGRGDGTFAAPSTVALAAASDAVAVADFDSDGVLDVIAVGGDRISIRFGSGQY